MARWKGGHCPKCGRPVAQKIGEPAKPCPDCTAAKPEAAERDSAVEQAVYWRERALDAEGREQALAAHVERLRDAGAELAYLMDGVREGDYKPDSFTNQPMNEAMAETPESSLARFKAQWQAEALEEFSDEWDWERQPTHKDLRHAAANLRRQAEGGGE